MGLILLVFAGLLFFGFLAFVATLIALPFVIAFALVVILLRLAIFFVMMPFRLWRMPSSCVYKFSPTWREPWMTSYPATSSRAARSATQFTCVS